jgi:hypothetical protein
MARSDYERLREQLNVGAESAGNVQRHTVIALSPLQRNALALILVDYSRYENATQEFNDIVSGEKTTLGELLSLVLGKVQ